MGVLVDDARGEYSLLFLTLLFQKKIDVFHQPRIPFTPTLI